MAQQTVSKMERVQTAVEWLEQSIMNNVTAPIYERLKREGYFDKAKQMEKQQIVDAANLPKDKRWYNAEKYNNCGEQYYNETYGGQGSPDTSPNTQNK